MTRRERRRQACAAGGGRRQCRGQGWKVGGAGLIAAARACLDLSDAGPVSDGAFAGAQGCVLRAAWRARRKGPGPQRLAAIFLQCPGLDGALACTHGQSLRPAALPAWQPSRLRQCSFTIMDCSQDNSCRNASRGSRGRAVLQSCRRRVLPPAARRRPAPPLHLLAPLFGRSPPCLLSWCGSL